MNVDRYTKALLTIIALALVVIAARPLFTPSPSYAAKAEYKVFRHAQAVAEVESQLNDLGRQGWEFVGSIGNGIVVKR
jgi:hypothetical protein